MWVTRVALLALTACCVTSTTSVVSGSPSDGARATSMSSSAGAVGGAHITKPFDRTVRGAQCFAGTGGNKGKAAFSFPNWDPTSTGLFFRLGPLTDGLSPGQEKNQPYSGAGIGAGAYTEIGILVRQESG